tara:strand:+ start:94 stop:483 length:390 start_codon:yes stop_codon:yes gene_type:complete
MAQKKRVHFKENVREVRSYDLEKSEVRMKRCGCLPAENEDLILHHPDMQKEKWRRVLQGIRKQDETIETNISKIQKFVEKYPDKTAVSDEVLNSIVGQLKVKVNLLQLKQEGVAKHRKICSENNLVSCM